MQSQALFFLVESGDVDVELLLEVSAASFAGSGISWDLARVCDVGDALVML